VKLINHIKNVFWVLPLLCGSGVVVAATPEADGAGKASVFAVIGKEQITWQEYQAEFNKEARNKLYHGGKPSDEVLATMQRAVADKMIDTALVLNEAKHRKLKPDSEVVKREVEGFERKMANDEQWKEARNRVLPVITKRFEDENLVKKMEEIVRKISAPKEAQVKEYYAKYPEKFTSPIEQRIALILLPVDPSSATEGWLQTIEDGKGLVKRIRDGEDFAAMAKLYSRDAATVDQGGDMGYMHDGMLPDLSQEVVNKLGVGDVSEPLRLLEGVAIFRLTDRRQPGLSAFDSVKGRATDLLLAEKSDQAWADFLSGVKKKTPMYVDESRFLPLAKTPISPTAADGKGEPAVSAPN
jgi:peptidyl-prolyl cis-trans isomerase C